MALRCPRYLPVVCACVAVLAACRPATTRLGEAITRDSAGVAIIQNGPIPGVPDWRLDSLPQVELRTRGGSLTQLFRVGAVVSLANGDFAVENGGGSAVLLFGSNGQFLRRVGREGGGPGEYRHVSGLYACGGDTLVVAEPARVDVFGGGGAFVRTRIVRERAPAGGLLKVDGISRDCTTLLLQSLPANMPALNHAGWVDYTFFRAARGHFLESIATIHGREVVTRSISGMPQPLSLPWGRDGSWAYNGLRFYAGVPDRPEIRVFADDTGLIQIVRWSASWAPVTASDRGLYQRRREKWTSRYPQLASIIPRLSAYPRVPSKKPLFLGFVADDFGRLWVRDYPRFVAGRPDIYGKGGAFAETSRQNGQPIDWTVFRPNGRILARIAVPGDLEIVSVSGNRVTVIRRDSLDVEHVEIYGIQTNASSSARP